MFSKIIFVFLIFGLVGGVLSGPVYARQTGAPERIPYNLALRGATRNLPAVRALEDAIDDIEEIRDSLRSLLQLRRDAGTITRPEESQMQRQIADLGAQINTMRVTRDQIWIGTEASMRASMASIANMKLDIELLEAAMAHDRVSLNNTRLRFEAGHASEAELRSLELLIQQAESNLSALQVSLETENQSLNRILQRPVTGNFYVHFDRELMELPANLDAHIRRYASNQPNVRQAEITLNRAQAAFSDVHLDILSPEFGERQRARNQAERVRNDTLRQVETDMRNRYNTLTALQHQKNSLEIELQRAKERYETAQINYQVGLATIFDIETAALGIFLTEIEIERNLNTFWNLQFFFQHPFLPMGR